VRVRQPCCVQPYSYSLVLCGAYTGYSYRQISTATGKFLGNFCALRAQANFRSNFEKSWPRPRASMPARSAAGPCACRAACGVKLSIRTQPSIGTRGARRRDVCGVVATTVCKFAFPRRPGTPTAIGLGHRWPRLSAFGPGRTPPGAKKNGLGQCWPRQKKLAWANFA
jgi:hypothetical protein